MLLDVRGHGAYNDSALVRASQLCHFMCQRWVQVRENVDKEQKKNITMAHEQG